jgi:hypothetical protein
MSPGDVFCHRARMDDNRSYGNYAGDRNRFFEGPKPAPGQEGRFWVPKTSSRRSSKSKSDSRVRLAGWGYKG